MTDVQRLSLHFKYCVAIALLIIVAIATERWSASEQFTTYLSNAATMTSLLLAVIAIFYSFVSNDSLSRSLGSITTISTEVQSARQQIGQYSEMTKEASAASSTNAALLRETSQEAAATVSSLKETLGAISRQNETLQGLVSALPTRIDQLETKVGDVAKALGEKPPPAQPAAATSDISSRAVEHFLARATLSQNLLTYACALAASSKKQLDIHAFGKAVGYEAPSNFNGFLNCMHSIELIDRKAVAGQDKVYVVSAVHPEVKRQTKSYLTDYIERAYADKPMEQLSWRGKMEAVEVLLA